MIFIFIFILFSGPRAKRAKKAPLVLDIFDDPPISNHDVREISDLDEKFRISRFSVKFLLFVFYSSARCMDGPIFQLDNRDTSRTGRLVRTI